MTTYAIALEPEKSLYDKVLKLKDIAKSLAGKQQYLDDPPHVTIYVGDFKPKFNWEYSFAKIIDSINNVSVRVNGWHKFTSDPITKKDTLVCSIEPSDQLKSVQSTVIEFLSKYKSPVLAARYKSVYNNLQKAYQENLDKYGFPFVGNVWKPHIGIASFSHEAFDKVWMHIKDKCPVGSYKIASINLFSVDTEDNIVLERHFHIK